MSYRLEQQSDGTSRIAEITGAEGLTLPRYRRTNQNTSVTLKPIVLTGDKVTKGQILT